MAWFPVGLKLAFQSSLEWVDQIMSVAGKVSEFTVFLEGGCFGKDGSTVRGEVKVKAIHDVPRFVQIAAVSRSAVCFSYLSLFAWPGPTRVCVNIGWINPSPS